ncbi:hypothetical protein V494_07501 [Pseudogymnoascus sp. VKM F-4513 (FW-928)]|nr:hypothetical protein V494_07501 [Pseudogymnoascus sp. VKM F-4513 (FW-928)]
MQLFKMSAFVALSIGVVSAQKQLATLFTDPYCTDLGLYIKSNDCVALFGLGSVSVSNTQFTCVPFSTVDCTGPASGPAFKSREGCTPIEGAQQWADPAAVICSPASE